MSLFSKKSITSLAFIALGFSLCSTFSLSLSARPPRPPQTVDCSFNNSIERCSYSEGTDGSMYLVWPGGANVSYDCGRYKVGVGTVGLLGKAGLLGKPFVATCKRTGDKIIFNTPNGITKFSLPEYYRNL